MFGMLPSRANPTMRVRKVPPIQKFGLRFRRRQTSWVRERDRLRRLTAVASSGSSAAGSRSSGASDGGEESIDMGSHPHSRVERGIQHFRQGGGEEDDHRGEQNVAGHRSEEHTSELQSRGHLVCRLLLEKKKKTNNNPI